MSYKQNYSAPNKEAEIINQSLVSANQNNAETKTLDATKKEYVDLNKSLIKYYRAKQSETKKSIFEWKIKIKNNQTATDCLNEWLKNSGFYSKNNRLNFLKSSNGKAGIVFFWSKKENQIWFDVFLDITMWKMMSENNRYNLIFIMGWVEKINFNNADFFLLVRMDQNEIRYSFTNILDKQSEVANETTENILNELGIQSPIKHNLGICPACIFFNSSSFSQEGDLDNEFRWEKIAKLYMASLFDLEATKAHAIFMGSTNLTNPVHNLRKQFNEDPIMQINAFSGMQTPFVAYNPNTQIDKFCNEYESLFKDIIHKSYGYKEMDHKGTVQQTNTQTQNQNDEADNYLLAQMGQQRQDMNFFVWKLIKICEKIEINLGNANVNWSSLKFEDIDCDFEFSPKKIQMIEQIAKFNNLLDPKNQGFPQKVSDDDENDETELGKEEGKNGKR